MPAIDHPLIDRFLETLWLERGASVHTRAAYRSDLALFNGWLEARGAVLDQVGREVILDHLAWRLSEGYQARSTARFISGLRGFYRYLLREGLVAADRPCRWTCRSWAGRCPNLFRRPMSRPCWRLPN